MALVAAALLVAATVGLSACGGGNSGETGTTGQQGGGSTAEGGGREPAAGGEEESPPLTGGVATLRRQFPEPKPEPGAPPAAQKAIDAGRAACRGKTPVEVRDEFLAEAEASGLLNPGQEKMLDQLPKLEQQAAGSPDFVAGQLAAGVYEATLPEARRTYGYQGCVYELALALEKKIKNG